MLEIMPSDILSAGRELPLERPELLMYITEHVKRLKLVNFQLGELVELIGKRASRVLIDEDPPTPEELGHYVSSLLLILIRTIENAETRAQTSVDDHPQSADTALAPELAELFTRLGKST